MTQAITNSVSELSKALSRIDGVKIFCKSDVPENEKLSIYFTYKEETASIEEQAQFIDWLSSLLVNNGDYTTMLSMNWWGDRNTDNTGNRPHFIIDTYVSTIDELVYILNRGLDIRKTVLPTFGTNYFPKSRNWFRTSRATEVIMSFFKNIAASISVPLSATLAKITRICKNCISYMLTRMTNFHIHNISKVDMPVNHNGEEPPPHPHFKSVSCFPPLYFYQPHPLYPPLHSWRGRIIKKEGAKPPLKLPTPFRFLIEEAPSQTPGYIFGGFAPLKLSSPPSLPLW